MPTTHSDAHSEARPEVTTLVTEGAATVALGTKLEDAAAFLDRVTADTGYAGARAWAAELRGLAADPARPEVTTLVTDTATGDQWRVPTRAVEAIVAALDAVRHSDDLHVEESA